ncbi:hypothetical protein HDU93_008170 [Gonapodya sp. JEL0774]|nr:hypothetical protein HDU93_008170 [Gonapodya sp. JEL0774]
MSANSRAAQISSQLAAKPGDPGDVVREKLAARVGRPRLEGKVCIVTGANSLKGIGRASCIAFAQNGAKAVYCTDYDSSNLPELANLIEKQYPSTLAIALQLDAANEADVKAICQRALSDFGRLDVFFANAGVGSGEILVDTTVETFNKTMRVNALGPFLACKLASTAMRVTSNEKPEAGGSIVCTASVAGMRSGAGGVVYSMSKAAVINLVAAASWQLQRTGVRVNAVNPGLTETGMTAGTFDYARGRGTLGKVGQLNPMGRYGVPEEIAAAVVFLASDDASYVNGQSLPAQVAVNGEDSVCLPRSKLDSDLWSSLQKSGWEETWGLVKEGTPVSLGYLMQILVPSSNAYFVGHLSTTYLAGLALGVMVANCTGVYVGFGAALSLDTLLSQAVTASDAESLDPFVTGVILQRGMLLMVFISAPLGFFWFHVEKVLLLLGQDPEVSRLAGRFCIFLLPGLLPVLWFECLKKYCQAMGYMRVPFYVQLVTVPVHLFTAYFLIQQNDTAIGFDGAAVSLCITYTLQFLILGVYISMTKGFGRWGGLDKRSLDNWWPMVRLAIPGVFLLCGEYWAYEIIALLAGVFGESALAAQTIALLTLTCTYQIVYGTTIASGNRIGNLLGENRWVQARVVAYSSFFLCIPLELINMVFLIAVRPVWGPFFTDDSQTADMVSQLLIAGAALQLADGVVMWAGGVVRGVGWQEVGAEANMVLYYLFGIPLGAYLAFKTRLGVTGLWLGLCLALYGVASVMVAAILRIDWREEARQARERALVEDGPHRDNIQSEQMHT